MRYAILLLTVLSCLKGVAQHQLIIQDYSRAIYCTVQEQQRIQLSLKDNPEGLIPCKVYRITQDSIYSKQRGFSIGSIRKIRIDKNRFINHPLVWVAGNVLILSAGNYSTSPEFIVGSLVGFNLYELVLLFSSSVVFDLNQQHTRISVE